MSRHFFGLRCRAEGLDQFRTTRPPPPPPNGPVQKGRWWRRAPSNGVAKRDWKDAELRQAMRPPRRDPYARLEFLRPEDLNVPLKEPPPSTAMPVEDNDLIKATKVRKEILRRLEHIQKEQLKKQLENGEITQDDLYEMGRDFKRAQEDPAFAEEMDRILHPEGEDGVYAEYPVEGDAASEDRSGMSFIEQLISDYQVPGYVEFEEMETKSGATIPVVRLSHCNGEEAVISLHGGCLLSWKGQDGKERLFQDPEEPYDERQPIRSSGSTLAFPQYGKSGVMPENGFLNRLLWDVVRSEVAIEWVPDPAPSVTLFCRDNEETRKIWPHPFEIYFKITLGETDEFGTLEEPIKEQRRFMKRAMEIGTLKGMKEELENPKKVEEEEEDEEEKDTLRQWRRRRKKNDRQKETSAATETEKKDNAEDEAKKEDAAEGEAGDEDSGEGEADDEEDMEPTGPIPTQLKLQFTVRNTGNEPVAFMLACLTRFKTRGLFYFGDYVRILGLGGRHYIDYNIVPGRPYLRIWGEDYLTLKKRKEGWNAIFTENVLNDVFFCPGREEYYESITRQGFPDVLLSQSSLRGVVPLDLSHQMTMLGRGRVTVPARLAPGEKWEGEYVLRHHDHYFREPVFGYQGGFPPPDIEEMELPLQSRPAVAAERR